MYTLSLLLCCFFRYGKKLLFPKKMLPMIATHPNLQEGLRLICTQLWLCLSLLGLELCQLWLHLRQLQLCLSLLELELCQLRLRLCILNVEFWSIFATSVVPTYTGTGLLPTLVVLIYSKSGALPTLVAPIFTGSGIFGNFSCTCLG